MDSIIVNGETYIKAQKQGDLKIVILQRGWVMVGNFTQEGDMCLLSNARVIRIWGTTKGLGEIALNGPTKSTVLDDTGSAKFHILTTIAILDCKAEKWK